MSHTTFVALDVETTGLDPQRDAIIEVATIVFTQDGIVDEFSSLVYPQQTISEMITNLTGITNEMVKDAPAMQMLRPKLRGIIGDSIVVGHNINFDLDFLKASFIGSGNPKIDTVTLASILLPNAGRYNLNHLIRYLNIPMPTATQEHRALADTRLTVELFFNLLEFAKELGLSRLHEIVMAGKRLGWSETPFFEEAMSSLAAVAFEQGLSSRPIRKLFDPAPIEGHNLTGSEDEMNPIDTEMIVDMLSPQGNFARLFPQYEYRAQQAQMVHAVAEALNQGMHLFIEAGTGTGKSVGYLLPASFWAEENQRHVVVSTNTINLQDQLITKDIPQLQQILPFELRAAILKGKSNYICTRLLEQMRRRGATSADEMVVYARLLTWLPTSETGDRAEISLRSAGEQIVWSRLSADNEGCNREVCAQERCPLHIARQRARRAHIVVVNHSLLLADLNAGNMILPPYYDLIIDEAHHLEAAITSSLSFRTDQRMLEAMLDEIIKPRAGQLGVIQGAVAQTAPPEIGQQFDGYCEQIRQSAVLAKASLEEFFTTINWFLKEQMSSRSQYTQQLRLTTSVRTQPHFDDIEIAWENFGRPLVRTADGVVKLAGKFDDIAGTMTIEDSDDLTASLTKLGRQLAETSGHMNGIISEPDDTRIYWIERSRDRVSLHVAPLHVGPLVQEHIFESKQTVVLASATLQTAKSGYGDEPSFEYIRKRLHGFEASEMSVGSPFDYQASTLVYLPTDMPEPNQPGYQRYVEQAIYDVATTLGGRTMALFTSYGQLNETAKALHSQLKQQGIEILLQSGGMSRQQLTEQFKHPEARAVLFGTKSFWEGVDIPGPALSAVCLVKIPFDVPSDPVFAARSETFENSFFEYSIPEAVLRFRQGFGRLIRRTDDEGVVVILDKRVLSKRYGAMFLEALPDCVFLRQRSNRLSELIKRWFNRDQ